jgi:hypothetical protein
MEGVDVSFTLQSVLLARGTAWRYVVNVFYVENLTAVSGTGLVSFIHELYLP